MINFIKGFIFYGCVSSLIQDLYFKTAENYTEFILNHWIHSKYSIPVAIILLILILFIREKTKDNNSFYEYVERKTNSFDENLPF